MRFRRQMARFKLYLITGLLIALVLTSRTFGYYFLPLRSIGIKLIRSEIAPQGGKPLDRFKCTSNNWYDAARDESYLLRMQEEISKLKNVPSTAMKQELDIYGISTRSIKDRYELERVLADARLKQTDSQQSRKATQRAAIGEQRKRTREEAHRLKTILADVEQLSRGEVQAELYERNIQYSPTYDRHTLDVLLAKDVMLNDRFIMKRNVHSVDIKNVTNTLHGAIRDGRENVMAGLNSIGEVATALSSTESEYSAKQKIMQSKRPRQSNAARIPSNESCYSSAEGRNLSNATLHSNINQDSTHKFLKNAAVDLQQLSTFDDIYSWACKQNRSTLCALLDERDVDQYSSSSSRQSLAMMLADKEMTQRTNQHYIDCFQAIRAEPPGTKNRKSLESSCDSLLERLNSFDDSTPMKEILSSFNIEEAFLATLPLRVVSTAKRLVMLTTNYITTVLRHGLFGTSNWMTNQVQLVESRSPIELMTKRFGEISSLIASFIVKVARWSGSGVFTVQQVLVLSAGYALILRGGMKSFVSTLIAIKVFCSLSGVSSNDDAAVYRNSTDSSVQPSNS